LTTTRDPEGRPTVYDVLGEAAAGLVAVGRLDLATSGLLVLTTDTALAAEMTDPRSQISRVYVATVRGRVSDEDVATLTAGVLDGPDRLRAESVSLRKVSGRESHVIVELKEGKNREVRRLFEAVGHEVTRLKRVAFGRLELGDLAPGQWREINEAEFRTAISTPAPLSGSKTRRSGSSPKGRVR
jgi:23S rRNA pseudouridine2605 synthase